MPPHTHSHGTLPPPLRHAASPGLEAGAGAHSPAPLSPALAALKAAAQRDARRQSMQEAMAVAANKLLTGPEDNVVEIKTLNALVADSDQQVGFRV